MFARPLASLLLLVPCLSAQDVPDGVGDVLYGRQIKRGQFGDHFGRSVDVIGDIDDDGVLDLVVGASHSNDGGEERGSVWILRMNADLTVKADQKISQIYGGLTSTLTDGGQFGKSVSGIGDLDGDGVEDIAVGASRVDELYILFLKPDGRVKAETRIHQSTKYFSYDQTAIPDLDGDGANELLISDGEHTALLYYMNRDGTVKSSRTYDFNDSGDWYGIGMETLGDMDGDGLPEVAIGDTGYGANIDGWGQGGVHLSFMGPGGTEKSSVLLTDGAPNLDLGLNTYPNFGRDIALLSDLDGNGVNDIAIGCSECALDGDPVNVGAVYIVFLNADGTAKDWTRIGKTTGNLGFPIGPYVEFGISLAPISDWNGDGTTDLVVGARFDDGTGAIYMLMLNDGTVTPPVANGSADVRAGPAPLEVTFTDSSTGSVDSWFWEFGDGYSSTEPDPTHVYMEEGVYDVVLTVTGPGGVSDTRTFTRVIDVDPPLVPMGTFEVTPPEGLAPLEVAFTDRSLGVLSSWSWAFGDGGASSERNPTHTYSAPGSYLVQLTLGGPYGTDTVTETVVAHPPVAPLADFGAEVTTGVFPLDVAFTDGSTGFVEEWLWHFGDGGTSTEANPTHTYTAPGVYPVSLTVTNGVGWNIRTVADFVVVDAPPPPVADFTANATSGHPTFEVAFTDRSSGEANSWRWDFGDGLRGTLRNPVHRYVEPGFYTVTLLVAGPGGISEEVKTDFVYVAPVADVVESITGGTTSSDDYVRGFQFQVSEPKTIVQLGIHDGNDNGILDNATPTPVGLWTAGGVLLAEATVSDLAAAEDGVFYGTVPPVRLEPGVSYVVACQVTDGGEPFFHDATGTLHGSFLWEGRRRTPGTNFVFPDDFLAVDPASDAEYFGPDLRFDDGPFLSVADVGVEESVGLVTVVATLQDPAPWAITVELETRSGTATEGADFVGTRETLVIPMGATTAQLDVSLVDDSLAEPTEYFEVSIARLSGALSDPRPARVSLGSDELPAIGDLVLSFTGGATSSNDSMRGNQFTVSEAVTVAALGVHDGNGDGILNNPGDTPVGLWTESGTLLAQASVPDSTAPLGGGFYAPIDPVLLNPGVEYVVAALLSSGGEPYLRNATVELDPRFTLTGDRRQSSTTTFQFPGSLGSANIDGDAEFFGGLLRAYLPDCDQDGIPDALDTGDPDCNGNGIPDTCESFTDCNGNGIPDECEPDCDDDGVPDDCDPCVPVASFALERTPGAVPVSVSFTDLSTGTITSWLWDFGDGTTSVEVNPTHVYAMPGVFPVTLTTSSPGGSSSFTHPDPIVAEPPILVAGLDAFPTEGPAPLSTMFADLSIGPPTDWLWDFGDGATSAEANPTHVYRTPGSYAVSLTVSDGFSSETAQLDRVIQVTVPAPPVADFSASPTSGPLPLLTTFHDLSTNGVTQWSWDFGDGTSSQLADPSHLYTAMGAFDVTLTVTSPTGQDTLVRAGEIQVTAPPPPAVDFIADTTAGSLPLAVQFTDLSSSSATSWLWDFGDGATSAERDPLHVYTTPGTFDVSLTAGNAGGATVETRIGLIEAAPYRLGFLDGSFEEGLPDLEPTAAWSILGGDQILVHPRLQPDDNAMPTQGDQWLEVSAAGSVAATPPSNPGGLTVPSSGGVGVSQDFRYGADQPVLMFDAAFVRDGALADGATNDWMSVELTDGTTTHCLFHADSFATFEQTSLVYDRPMTVTETVWANLAELYPGSTEATLFTLSVLVGNGGDGEDPSRGYVDHFRLVEDMSPRVTLLGCGVNPAGSLAVRGMPRLGETVSFDLDNPLGTHCPGTTFVTLYLSSAGQSSLPCGITIKNFGMDGGPGELLIRPGPTVIFSLPAPSWSGAGVPTTVDFFLPSLVGLVGLDLFAQGLFVDSTAACGVKFGLTGAAQLTLGL